MSTQSIRSSVLDQPARRPAVPQVRTTAGSALTPAGERARRRRDRNATRRPPSGLLPSGGRATAVTAEVARPIAGESWSVGRRMRLAATVTIVFALAVLSWRMLDGSSPDHTDITVHAGDTLYSIAHQARPEADPRAVAQQIRSLNGLSGDRIVPGQQLSVPVAG